jgi:hypothetical protein
MTVLDQLRSLEQQVPAGWPVSSRTVTLAAGSPA